MSYDTTLYVVKKHSIPNADGITCGKIAVQIDLASLGDETHIGRLVKSYTVTARIGDKPPFALPVEADSLLAKFAADGKVSAEVAFRINDGHVTIDSYDQWLGVMTIGEVIEALAMDLSEPVENRRFEWAHSLLTAVHDSMGSKDEFIIVTRHH